MLEVSSFYTCAPKIAFKYLWFLRFRVTQTNIFVTSGYFLPFYLPLLILNIKTLKKKQRKKCLEILSFYTYMFTLNEDDMIHGSWNIRCNRQNFSTSWAIFCSFSLLTTWKIKISTMKITPGDIAILHICTSNDNHMIYGSWHMEHNRHNLLSFRTVWTQKIKIFQKMEKISENIITLQR